MREAPLKPRFLDGENLQLGKQQLWQPALSYLNTEDVLLEECPERNSTT